MIKVDMVTCDSTTPVELGKWWAEQTGGEVTAENDGWFVVVTTPGGPRLGFQKVADPTPGKNKLHLDLHVDGDLDTAVEKLTGVGARLVADRTMDGFRWIVLADPDGNEFCIAK